MKTYPRQELFEDPIVTLKDVRPDWDGNLIWEGDLVLGNSDITKLPNNFKVGGSLYLYNTLIQELPDNLQVGNYIYFEKGKELDYIPEHLKYKIIILYS